MRLGGRRSTVGHGRWLGREGIRACGTVAGTDAARAIAAIGPMSATERAPAGPQAFESALPSTLDARANNRDDNPGRRRRAHPGNRPPDGGRGR